MTEVTLNVSPISVSFQAIEIIPHVQEKDFDEASVWTEVEIDFCHRESVSRVNHQLGTVNG